MTLGDFGDMASAYVGVRYITKSFLPGHDHSEVILTVQQLEKDILY